MRTPTADASPEARPLFFQRRMLPMWTALSLGTFADNMLRQSLLIGIPYGRIEAPSIGDPDSALPLVGALLPAAIFLFSPLGGQLADKFETSMMFRRIKFAEIILMLITAYAFIAGRGTLAIALLFFMGAQSAFFSPVRLAAMPKYFRPNELLRANSICNAGLFTFILLGYAVGGHLIVQPNGGLLVGIALVAAATIGWAAILAAPKAAANDSGARIEFNPLTQIAQMARLSAAAPGVPSVQIGAACFYALSTTVTVALPLYARDSLHAETGVANALMGLFAVGAGVGAIAAAAIPKGRSGLGAAGVAIAAAGLCGFIVVVLTPFAAGDANAPLTIAGLFQKPGGIALSALMVAMSGFAGLYVAPMQTAMQRRASPENRARILSLALLLYALFAIFGSLAVLGITETDLDPRFAFAGTGAAMLLIAAVMARRRATFPHGLHDSSLVG